MRETKYHAVILKKQLFGEGDEIITFFSKEKGKIRCLAKSVKSAKSKLQQKLQALFLVDVIVSHGKLPKIINVETVEVFGSLRENLPALKNAFVALELILKITPDEQKNEQLFNSLLIFLGFLNTGSQSEELQNLALAKFKIQALEASGYGISYPDADGEILYFNLLSGGFTGSKNGMVQRKEVLDLFKKLKTENIQASDFTKFYPFVTDLQNLLTNFIEYQLERKMKSEKFLKQ